MSDPISHAEMIAWMREEQRYAPTPELVAMKAAVLAHLERTQWRRIEEAPKDGTLILISWAGSEIHPVISRWLKLRQGWTHPFNKPVNPPTHWMPLPSSPETP
jgi:hypothetical protein